jgi:hypothetical protein
MKVGDIVIRNGIPLVIICKKKGGKTNKPNYQGGIQTGFKSKPCRYVLSNGHVLTGKNLK